MHETIVNAATKILIDVFEQAGWQSDEDKEKVLKEAIDKFMTKSSAITADGINNWSYAVISHRIMDKHRKMKISSETEMGLKLWEMEEELQDIFDNLGMSEFIDDTPCFSIIFSGKTRMITEELATYGLLKGHSTPARKFKRKEKNLAYSEMFGSSPKTVVSVCLDEK